ncbi:hypothetical protein SPRG_08700 [Saprolegnia parasitica CBS 223.65]|uniref:Uncharacterized protein n=1 Tax=Saprolegnia parasitica (strain CBS 223.65) TaxID=695850 RepID=A0A067CGU9_SAPPC|nr:hypothetical protein SPRG_08700 [Saprolegnia parasitica CBS 223.65]KDO26047.1 hypothetical protein SPRG_08700 [Saprolegnia parasitica CBS 223.65]|eukprot:XP_012203333.1 hypothetical protein SPRG_08700 [Saprolegnia parasitica CBS 223.65]
MQRAVLCAAMAFLALSDASSMGHKKGCKHDHKVCADGSRVYRNVYYDCDFNLCPEEMSDEPAPTTMPPAAGAANATAANATAPTIAATTKPPTPAPTTRRRHQHNDEDDDEDEDDDDDGENEDEKDARQALVTVKPTAAATVKPTLPAALPTATHGRRTKVEWISINKMALPKPVGASVARAFAAYNLPAVCSTFDLNYTSIEMQGNDSRYHIVLGARCILHNVLQIEGTFRLCLFQSPTNAADPFHVSSCSFLGADNVPVNYLAVAEANEGVCQTPSQKRAFDDQPLQYSVTAKVASVASFDVTVQHLVQDNAGLAAAAGIAAVVFVVAVIAVVRRRRRGPGSQRLGSDAPDAPSAVDDVPATTTSQVEGTFDVTTQSKA